MKKLSKSKMKIVVCVLCVVCVFSLVGVIYWINVNSNDVQMPSIVFTYCNYDYSDEEKYDIWYIDNVGNIFQTHNEEFSTIKYSMDNYSTMITDESVQLIEKIDLEVLEDKYKILQRIRTGGNNELIEPEGDIFTEQYIVRRDWGGYCYDRKGNLVGITLQIVDNPPLPNKDPRAAELADWISDVIGLSEDERGM